MLTMLALGLKGDYVQVAIGDETIMESVPYPRRQIEVVIVCRVEGKCLQFPSGSRLTRPLAEQKRHFHFGCK